MSYYQIKIQTFDGDSDEGAAEVEEGAKVKVGQAKRLAGAGADADADAGVSSFFSLSVLEEREKVGAEKEKGLAAAPSSVFVGVDSDLKENVGQPDVAALGVVGVESDLKENVGQLEEVADDAGEAGVSVGVVLVKLNVGQAEEAALEASGVFSVTLASTAVGVGSTGWLTGTAPPVLLLAFTILRVAITSAEATAYSPA